MTTIVIKAESMVEHDKYFKQQKTPLTSSVVFIREMKITSVL